MPFHYDYVVDRVTQPAGLVNSARLFQPCHTYPRQGP